MRAYKGNPPKRFDVFTYRDSGGFYLDKGMSNDLGGEYLLFLNPIMKQKRPLAAKGATEVNYACGQSKAWQDVGPSEVRRLTAFSH